MRQKPKAVVFKIGRPETKDEPKKVPHTVPNVDLTKKRRYAMTEEHKPVRSVDEETMRIIEEAQGVSSAWAKLGKPWHITSITATRIDGSTVTVEVPPCPHSIKFYGGME